MLAVFTCSQLLKPKIIRMDDESPGRRCKLPQMFLLKGRKEIVSPFREDSEHPAEEGMSIIAWRKSLREARSAGFDERDLADESGLSTDMIRKVLRRDNRI